MGARVVKCGEWTMPLSTLCSEYDPLDALCSIALYVHASWFQDAAEQLEDGQYFDLGADRAVAQTLPAYLTASLAGTLNAAGGTRSQVVDAS